MTGVTKVNETSRAFTCGRVQGYNAGFSGGVSMAMMVLQVQRDSTKSPTRQKIINNMLAEISRAEAHNSTKERE